MSSELNEDGSEDCLNESSFSSLMRVDSKDQSLDSVRQNMLDCLSASPSACLEDKVLLDYLPLASKLLIESFEETEQCLSSESTGNVRSKFTLWENSLEPWHEFLKQVKNLGEVPSRSIDSLLDILPEIIQTVFSHCKRSESLYGEKFTDLLPQLTALFRQTKILLDLFFLILKTVKFDDLTNEKNSLMRVFEKIGDIAVMTNGMDLKTLLMTWTSFAKLAMVHDSLLKKLGSTECITRRYRDVAKDIQTLLHDSFRDKKETSCEREIKCAGLLLKILARLCTLYRGYCGNKVFEALVQLLTKLYRYSPPFPAERDVGVHSKIAKYSETHIVPTTAELLSALVEEKEFRKAFFEYGKLEIGEPICYHLLILRILEELIKRQRSDLSSWLAGDGNIVETALANVNNCGTDFMVNDMRISIETEIISGKEQQLGAYEVTLGLISHFVALIISDEDFEAVEMVLLRHLLSGEFWSSLMSCDLWTHLGKIIASELCREYLSYFRKIQKSLITREKSFEFEMVSNLIGRLYELLPEGTKESVFRELVDYSNRRLVDPFRASLPARARQYLSRHPSIDATSNMQLIFQDLRRCPSVKNWTRLTILLRSIGAIGTPRDERLCIVTLRSIWNLVAAIISRTQGVTREMLCELVALLLDCNQIGTAENLNNDQTISLIYKSMFEITEEVPIEHRIKINVFLRENLESYANGCGKQSLPAITELFCSLLNDENPWVRQESFETYAEYMLNGPSAELFDEISVGISKLPRLCREMSAYFSNKQVHAFTHYDSLGNYLRHLAETARERSNWHKCYEPDFRQRDEKMPRIQAANVDQRVIDICDDLQQIVARKNELENTSIDRLRVILLQLLEP